MMTPAWLLDTLAAVMLVVSAVSAARLMTARPWRHAAADADIDVSHLLMGISMAGMLAASLRSLPDGTWEVIFALLTAWFAWCVYREVRSHPAHVLASSHYMPHLVHAAAMLYMVLAAPSAPAGGPGMNAMGGASGAAMQTLRLPSLALVFALVLAGYTVRDLDLLSGPGRRYGLTAVRLAPAAALAATPGPAGSPARAGAIPGPATPGDGRAAHSDFDAPARRPVRPLVLAPQMATGCRIAMGITMAFMIIIMI